MRAYFCITDEGSDPVMLEALDVKSMQAQGLIEGGEQASVAAPERVTPERYDQIKRVAARYLHAVSRDVPVGRTA